MKKIYISCNKIYFNILKEIHDRICNVKNISSELIFANNYNIDYTNVLEKYDAFIIDNNFDKSIFGFENAKEDLFIKNENEFKKYDLFFLTLDYIIKNKNIDISKSNILVLDGISKFDSIYKLSLNNEINNVYIATIDFDKKFMLNKIFKRIKYSDISRLNNIGLIINLSEMGNIFNLESTPFQNIRLDSKLAIDLNILPLETTFAMILKNMKIETISGMYIKIMELLKAISIIFDREDIIYTEFIHQIYFYVTKKLFDNNENELDNTISDEYLKLFERGKNE